MGKRVLFIDYINEGGHALFNRIQLKAITSINNTSVDIIMRSDCNDYGDLYVKPLLCIPSRYYLKSPLGFRISLIMVQLILYFKVKSNNYDYVIFSSYDALTFWMMPRLRNKVFLFNHNNIARYDNKFELGCAKLIGKNVEHLVLNKYTQHRMQELGFPNVQVVLHGFDVKTKESTLSSSRYTDGNFSKIIFCPSQTSSDSRFLQLLLESNEFKDYLKDNNYLFIIKGNYKEPECSNIRVINGWLSTDEYNLIFLKADLLLLLYHENFRYRVSGVLFECIANNKKCLMSDTPNFRAYQDYINYDAYTQHNINEVMKRIPAILNIDMSDYYKNKSSLQPNWETILKD